MRMSPLLLVSAFFSACSTQGLPIVESRGTLHGMMMQNDVGAKVRLDTLVSREHVYGLGAVENLDGEIWVWDSDVRVSRIRNDSIETVRGDRLNAAFLVYSLVTNWDRFEISGPVRDLRGLENEIARILDARDISGPTAFLVEGQAVQLTGHVITTASAGAADHHLSGYPVNLTDMPVELLGFHSARHRGVFTHGDSDIHVHFYAREPRVVGHVDELKLTGPLHLLLPRD